MPTPESLTVPDKLDSLNATKQAIREAIVAKGVEVPEGTTFYEYAGLIGEIKSGGGNQNLFIATCKYDKTPVTIDIGNGVTLSMADRNMSGSKNFVIEVVFENGDSPRFGVIKILACYADMDSESGIMPMAPEIMYGEMELQGAIFMGGYGFPTDSHTNSQYGMYSFDVSNDGTKLSYTSAMYNDNLTLINLSFPIMLD